MNAIIAPTDFSTTSRNAVNYAAGLANHIAMPLILFHVVEIPLSVADTPLPAINLGQFVENAEAEMDAMKKQLLLTIGSSILISTRIVIGSIEHELEKICAQKKPFAVVMGSENTDDKNRFFIGSNTVTAVKKLNHPIFIIPPSARFVPVKRIVFAAGLEDVYEVPVESVAGIVKALNASLDVVHVSSSNNEKIKEAVPAAVLQNRLKALHAEVQFVIDKNITEGIGHFAQKHEDDIILALPKQHHFFEFHASQAKKLALHATLPVLALPSRKE